MQGRLELSSPEATCLLAARKKRKSLVLYHILVYNKHIIIDISLHATLQMIPSTHLFKTGLYMVSY